MLTFRNMKSNFWEQNVFNIIEGSILEGNNMSNVSGLNSVKQFPVPVVSLNASSPYAGMPMDRQQQDMLMLSEKQNKQEKRQKWQTIGSLVLAASFAALAFAALKKLGPEMKATKAQEEYFKKAADEVSGKAKKGANEKSAKKLYDQFEDLSNNDKIVGLKDASIDDGFRKFGEEVQLSADAPKELLDYVGEDATSNMIIVEGRSGYGKSYDGDVLAKAIRAKRIKKQFSSWSSEFVGKTAVNVTDYFNNLERVLKEHPEERFCMILDEADSLFTPLEHIRADQSYLKETRSAILNGIDQVRKYPNFFMVATTNADMAAGKLDEAIVRRFAFNYQLKAPNITALTASHKSHLKGFKGIEGLYDDPVFQDYLQKLNDKGAGHGDVENLVRAVKTKWKAKIINKGIEAGCLDKTTRKCTDVKAFNQILKDNPLTGTDFQEALKDIGQLAIETRKPPTKP